MLDKLVADSQPSAPAELLSIRNLEVHLNLTVSGKNRIVKAVDGISLDICKGETLGLVGESGCGKSTTARALLRLIDQTAGEILYRGKGVETERVPVSARKNGGVDLAKLSTGQMRPLRRYLQIIFQDPYSSLNPRMTAGSIIAEPIKTFHLARGEEVHRRVQELLNKVGLSPRCAQHYPHEFSGGQRQRIGIARALALDPEFIVADEPISALDASIQSQILNLMSRLQKECGLTYLFISHDLRVVKHISNRIAVMYLGKIVELGNANSVYEHPLMPYTRALISAIPVPDPKLESQRRRIVLSGEVPSPINPPSGCRFRTRCPYAIRECAETVPVLREITPNHFAACIRISPEQPDIDRS